MSKPSRAAKLTTIMLTVLMAMPILPIMPAAAAPGNGWGIPTYLPGTGGADGTKLNYASSMVSNRDGNVFLVYTAYNGATNVVIATRYYPGVGWGGAVTISNISLYAYGEAQVAVDPYGNAFALWNTYNASYSGAFLQYSFYTPLTGWSSPRDYTVNTTAYPVQLKAAMDGLGNAYTLHRYYNGTGYEVWLGQVNMDGTQSPMERFQNYNATTNFVALAGSPTGGAIAATSFYDGSNYNMWATRYQVGAGWTAPVLLENRTSTANEVNAGFDDTGQARVLWSQNNGGFYFYDVTWSSWAGWSPERGVFPTSTYGQNPHMVVLPSGMAVLAYNSYNFSASRYCLNVIRNIPGTGWQTPALCTEYIPGPGTLDFASDLTGNGMIVYRNSTDGQPYGAEFTSQGVNPQAKVLLASDSTSGFVPTVASTGHGSAMVMVTWYNSSAGYYQAKVNRWAGIDTAAPWVTIDRPLRGASFSSGFAEVTGTAEPGSDVLVNGARAVVYPNGTYTALAPLSEGANLLQAVAVDAAGNRGYSNTKSVWQTEMTRINEPERNIAMQTGWQAVIPFDNVSYGSAWWPNIESDAHGNAWVTWYEPGPGSYNIYAARYQTGVGWTAPMLMRHADGQNIYDYPQLAVDADGNALILWNEYNQAGTNITTWAKVWTVAGGWQEEMRVDNASNWAYQISAAASNDGRFMVAWRQDESPSPQVYAMEYRVGTGWANRTRVSFPGNVSHVPDVTYNSTGYAQLVYCWRPGTFDVIMMANMTPAGVWSAPAPLQNLTPQYISGQPEIKSGSSSNFTVSWAQVNGSLLDSRAGRFVNGSWMGSELLAANTWSWPQELLVDAQGYAYVAQTETRSGPANAWVWVSAPGQPFNTGFMLDNGTDWGGGPRLSLSFNKSTASVMWDEVEGGLSHGNMRTYNKATSSWGPVVRHEADTVQSNIPDLAPMPDGGYLVAFARWFPSFGGYQISGQRYIPVETQAPPLIITTPTNGFFTTSATMRVEGTTESGALVTINGVVAAVAPNGSFSLDIALVNGTNSIYITSRDAAGNTNSTWRNGTFDDPDRRRIEGLEAQNTALQAQLNATNASLTAALAAQNSSLLGAISSLNASLVAQLAAQNTSLLNAIAGLNASVLAQLAAQNTSLLNLIAQTNASLLASLAAGDAALASLIATTNASLLASLAAQNSALLATIASTNASLYASLAAQNASLLGALAGQNASLLASLAAQNQSLANLIATTNASLLAALAAQDADLRAELADQNTSLLASLAAQNSALLDEIGSTNSSLLARLAATNSTLYAQLTAGDGALWSALNASAAAQASALAGTNQSVAGTQSGLQSTNESLSITQNEVTAAQQAANSAALMGTLGLVIGLAGVGLAAFSFVMARRGGRPPSGGDALRAPPPTPGGAEPVDAQVVHSGGSGHGHSMAAESELGGSGENQ